MVSIVKISLCLVLLEMKLIGYIIKIFVLEAYVKLSVALELHERKLSNYFVLYDSVSC